MAIVGNFTYSGSPASSPRDAVRFLIRDTIEATAQLSDEEIAWMLSEYGGNVYLASIGSVDFIANNYATAVQSKSVGGLSISYAARAEEYRSLGAALRRRWGMYSIVQPYAGGISRSDKRTNEQDTDWDKPSFTRNMMSYPGSQYDMREVPLST